jgi:hypothetical protein
MTLPLVVRDYSSVVTWYYVRSTMVIPGDAIISYGRDFPEPKLWATVVQCQIAALNSRQLEDVEV